MGQGVRLNFTKLSITIVIFKGKYFNGNFYPLTLIGLLFRKQLHQFLNPKFKFQVGQMEGVGMRHQNLAVGKLTLKLTELSNRYRDGSRAVYRISLSF